MIKYFDTVLGSTGAPLVGVSVTVYQAGTLTLASLYSNNTGTATSNPVTTDSNGLFQFYVADGRYDLKIEKAGFGSYTVSDVQIDEQDTSGAIPFTPAGNLSATTVQGAIVELDAEKAAVGHNHDGIYSPVGHDHAGVYQPAGSYANLAHGHAATAIAFGPYGNLAATTVNAALIELDTEKMAVPTPAASTDNVVTHKLAVSIGGQTYYLLASTSGA